MREKFQREPGTAARRLSRIARRRHLPSISAPAAQLSQSGDMPRCPFPQPLPFTRIRTRLLWRFRLYI